MTIASNSQFIRLGQCKDLGSWLKAASAPARYGARRGGGEGEGGRGAAWGQGGQPEKRGREELAGLTSKNRLSSCTAEQPAGKYHVYRRIYWSAFPM